MPLSLVSAEPPCLALKVFEGDCMSVIHFPSALFVGGPVMPQPEGNSRRLHLVLPMAWLTLPSAVHLRDKHVKGGLAVTFS